MWWIIPIVFALFILIIVIRALMFTPKVIQNEQFEEIILDKEKATANLVELIKCKTVSYKNSELEDEREFQKFISEMKKKRTGETTADHEFEELPEEIVCHHK